jgi:hypothetical protein
MSADQVEKSWNKMQSMKGLQNEALESLATYILEKYSPASRSRSSIVRCCSATCAGSAGVAVENISKQTKAVEAVSTDNVAHFLTGDTPGQKRSLVANLNLDLGCIVARLATWPVINVAKKIGFTNNLFYYYCSAFSPQQSQTTSSIEFCKHPDVARVNAHSARGGDALRALRARGLAPFFCPPPNPSNEVLSSEL